MKSLTVDNTGLSDSFFSRHMYIQVRIENKDLIALVDTGASGVAFVSESLCQRLNLPHQVISPPISLTGFEGGRESLITSKTSFKLAIGRHLEKLSAFCH